MKLRKHQIIVRVIVFVVGICVARGMAEDQFPEPLRSSIQTSTKYTQYIITLDEVLGPCFCKDEDEVRGPCLGSMADSQRNISRQVLINPSQILCLINYIKIEFNQFINMLIIRGIKIMMRMAQLRLENIINRAAKTKFVNMWPTTNCWNTGGCPTFLEVKDGAIKSNVRADEIGINISGGQLGNIKQVCEKIIILKQQLNEATKKWLHYLEEGGSNKMISVGSSISEEVDNEYLRHQNIYIAIDYLIYRDVIRRDFPSNILQEAGLVIRSSRDKMNGEPTGVAPWM